MKYTEIKHLLLIFVVFLLNGCNINNNNVLDNKSKLVKKQNAVTNDQIIRNNKIITNTIKKHSNEQIKPDNPFKKERDELIERR